MRHWVANLAGVKDFTLTPSLSLKGEGELENPSEGVR